MMHEEMGEKSYEKAKDLILQAKEISDAKGIDFEDLVKDCMEGMPEDHMAMDEGSEESEPDTEKEAKKTAIIIALKKKSDSDNGY